MITSTQKRDKKLSIEETSSLYFFPIGTQKEKSINESDALLYASNILTGSGDYYIFGSSDTAYTKSDDIVDSVLFNSINEDRCLDIERSLLDYEKEYKTRSDEFYKRWLTDEELDNPELNKWAELYSFLRYAKGE